MVNEDFPTESRPTNPPQPETQALRAEQPAIPQSSYAKVRQPVPVYTPRERYPKRRALGRDLALAGALLLFCFCSGIPPSGPSTSAWEKPWGWRPCCPRPCSICGTGPDG